MESRAVATAESESRGRYKVGRGASLSCGDARRIRKTEAAVGRDAAADRPSADRVHAGRTDARIPEVCRFAEAGSVRGVRRLRRYRAGLYLHGCGVSGRRVRTERFEFG